MFSIPQSNSQKIKSFLKKIIKIGLYCAFFWLIYLILLFSLEPVLAEGAVSFSIDEENTYHKLYDANTNNIDRTFQVITFGYYSYLHNDEDLIHIEFSPNQTVYNVHMWIVPYDCSKDARVQQYEDYVFYNLLIGDQTVVYEKDGYSFNSKGLWLYIRYDYNSSHVGYVIYNLHNLDWGDFTDPKQIAANAIAGPTKTLYDIVDVTTTVVSFIPGVDVPNPIDEGIQKATNDEYSTYDELQDDAIWNNPVSNAIHSTADLIALFSDFITIYQQLNHPQTIIFNGICILMVYIGFKSLTLPQGSPITGIIFIVFFGGALVLSTGGILGLTPENLFG